MSSVETQPSRVSDAQVVQAHSGELAFGGRLRDREEREATLAATLAPGATRPVGAGHRSTPEEADPFRLCFERDLDRVKHSTAWRRLAGKCQVFVAPEDDHLRTRMTHAIEVAQVAVGVARVAGLCVPLVEAIALGHDCGHGPGGHASEEAFGPFMPDGQYHHALYGADVTLRSLNLCHETLDGIRNHSWNRPAPITPEGEVVAWADRIAYVCHDFEDACREGVVAPENLPQEVREVVGVKRSRQLDVFILAMLAAIDQTGRVGMTEPAASALRVFRAFNFERIYLRPAATRQAGRVIDLLRGLVEYFIDDPGALPDVRSGQLAAPLRGSSCAAESAVRYVSGMTDRYALALGEELLGRRPEQLPRGV